MREGIKYYEDAALRMGAKESNLDCHCLIVLSSAATTNPNSHFIFKYFTGLPEPRISLYFEISYFRKIEVKINARD